VRLVYVVLVNATKPQIAAARQHTTYAVTVRWAEGEQHTIRYVKEHPYETIVGSPFTSKKALTDYAKKHGLVIAYWT
jgi:hypothetical protein